MVSGSTVANVASTGSITIPMMKRYGFRPEHAAAIEAVASAGGQFAPPVMGLTAFLIVGMTGIPYRTVMLAAVFPALIYYGNLAVAVHLQAHAGRLGTAKDEVLRLARRHRVDVMPVGREQSGELEGYLRVVDLYLSDEDTVQTTRPLMKLDRKASPIHALVQLQSQKEELAQVVDDQGGTVGLLYANDLAKSLIRGTA
jgi:TRAP-type uncharacterized transport system fused permease subunit